MEGKLNTIQRQVSTSDVVIFFRVLHSRVKLFESLIFIFML